MKAVKIHNDETVINEGRLRELLEKERAHDAYVWATKRMADRSRYVWDTSPSFDYRLGFRSALTDFAQLVVDAPVVEVRPT